MVYEHLGPPKAWKRARRCGSRYFDSQAEEKKELVSSILSQSAAATLVPFSLHLIFEMPIPMSWSQKKKREFSGKPHRGRPDLDNLIKYVGDALNEVLWKDDALIYQIVAKKEYSSHPKTLIMIVPWRENELLCMSGRRPSLCRYAGERISPRSSFGKCKTGI